MMIIGGELWITARESAARAGYQLDHADLQHRGNLAKRLARREHLRPVRVPAPPGVPWTLENAWPERIWIEVAWNLYRAPAVNR
jgi:hypothetical protein